MLVVFFLGGGDGFVALGARVGFSVGNPFAHTMRFTVRKVGFSFFWDGAVGLGGMVGFFFADSIARSFWLAVRKIGFSANKTNQSHRLAVRSYSKKKKCAC